jgi:uncharacterized protein (TIGR03437 family)
MSGGLLIKSAGKDPATYTISSSVVTPAGGNWLSLSINGTTLANGATGTTPASIDIGANVTGLGLGTYAGTIVITPAVGAVQTIPVKLSIIGGTPLVSPARLHFTYQPGGTPPPAQTVQVTDPGGAAVPFVAMMCSINTSAFSVTPSSGTTPATVSVSMNAGLYGTPGTYSSQVCTGPVGQTAAIVEVSYTITPAVETLTSSPLSLSFTYETGGSVPAPQYLQVNALQFLTPIGVAVSTDAKWLSISPVSGGTPATVVTTISPAGLAAGNYLANLTIDSALPGVAPITVPVTLSVTAGAAISASPAFVSAMTGGTNSPPQVIQLIATGNAAIPFTVARGTFSVTPMSGTTPAKLTVSPAVSCSPGTYSTFIAINPATGGNPQLLIPATITVTPDIVSVPASLKFAYRIGGSAPAARTIQIASADSGPVRIGAGNASGSWLVVTPANATPPAAATVSVDPTGLVPGIYTAYVSIGSIAYGSIQSSVPVTLTITDGPPISVAPSGLFDQAGPMPPQPHEIGVTAAGNAAVPFSVAVQGGDGWLSVTPASGVTPATLTASYSSAAMVSGTYAANIVITPGTAGNAETVIPVSVIMNPQYAAMAPHVSAVMNGGSYEMGQVSPGGLVSIFGDRLGPVTPAYLTLDATGKVAASLGGVVVTFDGVPAPLLYVSATQINAVVPYEVAEHQNVDIAVAYGGAVSNEPTLYSSTAQPGVFTQNGSGTGPGAILNQDSSLNTEANPAAVGSVVQIFMTGEGLTTPAQATGAVTEVNTSGAGPLTPAPQQAVSVTIGGQPAPLEFAGEAPGDVAGVLQVNATVPAVASGANPITVQVGANSSQTGVTVWVK